MEEKKVETPAPVPSKPDDGVVAAPAVAKPADAIVPPPLSQPPVTGHVDVQPAPAGSSPLSSSLPVSTTESKTPTSLPAKPAAKPKQKSSAGIVVGTILVMLALCALAVLAYMNNKA
jgi:hypothetical protein